MLFGPLHAFGLMTALVLTLGIELRPLPDLVIRAMFWGPALIGALWTWPFARILLRQKAVRAEAR